MNSLTCLQPSQMLDFWGPQKEPTKLFGTFSLKLYMVGGATSGNPCARMYTIGSKSKSSSLIVKIGECPDPVSQIQ